MNSLRADDERWMRAALVEAQLCLTSRGHTETDVPVGAVCVLDGQVIGRGHNQRELDADPTAHAEILAIRDAAEHIGDWRLHDVSLYVTLEPCPMCAGAIWLSRLSRVVFAAWDNKAGACGSLFDIPRDPRLNHRPEVQGGVLEAEAAGMLREFFRAQRNQKQELSPSPGGRD